MLAGAFSLARPVHASLDTEYLQIYLGFSDAERLEKSGDFKAALSKFLDASAQLAKVHQHDPDWEPVLVQSRREDCRAKVLELQLKIQTNAPAPPPTFNDEQLKQRAIALGKRRGHQRHLRGRSATVSTAVAGRPAGES